LRKMLGPASWTLRCSRLVTTATGYRRVTWSRFFGTRRAFARPDEDKRAKQVLEDWWTLVKPYALVDQCYPAPSDTDATFAEKVVSES
jgi:hypothetical protein